MLFLPIPGAEDKKAHKNSALTAETAVQWRYLFNSCAFFCISADCNFLFLWAVWVLFQRPQPQHRQVPVKRVSRASFPPETGDQGNFTKDCCDTFSLPRRSVLGHLCLFGWNAAVHRSIGRSLGLRLGGWVGCAACSGIRIRSGRNRC